MRQVLKNDVPEEWRDRLKANLCPVCGKTKLDFDKGQKVFCSIKCRDDYASKYAWWSEVRAKILARDNDTCQKCGINSKKLAENYEKIKKERFLKWAKENPEIIKTRRDELLVRLDRQFKEEYERYMDDFYIADIVIEYEKENEIMKGTPAGFPTMDIDHIIPVALGGDMWDEKNMRTLCENCHKEKTAEDMKLIAEKRQEKKVMVNGQKTL